MKPDTEKGIGSYVYADFLGRCNQEEGKYSDSVLSRTWYLITYANYPIIWASQIQIEISLSTTKAEYIDFFTQWGTYYLLWAFWMKLSSYSSFKETPRRYCALFSKIHSQF